MSINPRKIAVQIIYNIFKNRTNLSDELANVRHTPGASELDLRFISELTTGTIRNLEYIDYAISIASKVKLNKISPFVMSVIRIGVYQLLFMDKVPQSAAVNESVKIISRSGNRSASGFANAVLRKVVSTGKAFSLPEDEIKGNSIRYSVPEWIVSLYKDTLGSEYELLLKSMNTKPDTLIRVNKLKTDAASLIEQLNREGWQTSQYISPVFDDIDYLVCAKKITNLQDTKAYKDGLFYVQDAAGAYVAKILNPKSGSVVFDMCASPGGKTTHLAEKMDNKGKIFAFDVSNNKIARILENSKRLGIDIIEARVMDSSVSNSEFYNMADYLLVDAPCSGLGIIRRKPDIKYLRKEEDCKELSRISLNILNASAPYLKKGGMMVFSTCTTVYEENEGVLYKFLAENPDFSLVKIDCNKENSGFITLYPHTDNCDGFFISLLKRN